MHCLLLIAFRLVILTLKAEGPGQVSLPCHPEWSRMGLVTFFRKLYLNFKYFFIGLSKEGV